jgi:hypothetical protein
MEIAKRFHERLKEITSKFANGARALPLPPWKQLMDVGEIPDFPVLRV